MSDRSQSVSQPHADSPDGELVTAYTSGDRSAFEALYRRHRDRVFGIALGVLTDRDAALDVTQDVFVRLVSRLDDFEGRAEFTTWLHRVVVNACYDSMRRSRAQPTDNVVEIADAAEPGASGTEHVERVDVVRALAGIDADQRVVVVLADLVGYRYREIAEMLDLPLGTVQSRLARGRAAVASRLGNNFGASSRRRGESEEPS